MILIGSRAMLAKLHKTNEREQRLMKADYDVIMSYDEFREWYSKHGEYILSMFPRSSNKYKVSILKNDRKYQYEIELGFEGTSSEFLLSREENVCYGQTEGLFGEPMNILKLQYQLLTKKSHLIYPVHFEKNIADYHEIKDLFPAFTWLDDMKTYYEMRSNEAKMRYKQRTPNLNVTTEDFFSSKLPVESYFVHDDIHRIMAHYDRPVFEMMQRDSSKAWCEKDMFFALPYLYQIRCVQEEAYVIALERYIIPQYGEDCNDHFACYQKAVKRICTTLTSGWFREFAIENYPKVISEYNKDFVSVFESAAISKLISLREGQRIENVPLLAK